MYYNSIMPNNNIVSPAHVIRTGQILVANRGLEHVNCILPQQGNKGGLYLGDIVSTLKTQLLEKHQIKSILSCMIEPISSATLQKYITSHKILPIRDTLQFPILQYFKESRQFIHQSRQKGHNVLVHCHAGVSRSAAIVCAYLMSENLWDFEKTINFIRDKRYRAKPNANFVQQLITFYNEHVLIEGKRMKEATLRKKSSKDKTITKGCFKITLDEETQVHSELLSIEQRKFQAITQKKEKAIYYKKQHLQQNGFNINSNNKKLPIFDNAPKPEIHFNKVFDSKQKNGILENRNLIEGRSGYRKSTVITKERFCDYDGDMKDYQTMARSMLNVNVSSQSGSYISSQNTQFTTPHKQKSSLSNIKTPIIFNTPTHKVQLPIYEHVLTPNLHTGQNIASNRFSSTGNHTPHKPYY